MNANFDCIFYYVHDLDRSVTFYTDVLGLHLESRDDVARLRLDGVLVELVPAPASIAISGTGNARLCLRVPDIHRSVAELKGMHAPVGEIHQVQNGIVGSLFDPDGNELALWQYS
jgi:catechol 2,3-dioxygenase-like lactoylglutathione lyase family enzyme